MKRHRTAILLNAFVLPGMGQLYLGRKVTGIVIILLVNLLLLVTVFVLLKGFAPVLAARMMSGSFNPGVLLAALQSIAGVGKALIAGFALVWLFSIVDILRNRTGEEPNE